MTDWTQRPKPPHATVGQAVLSRRLGDGVAVGGRRVADQMTVEFGGGRCEALPLHALRVFSAGDEALWQPSEPRARDPDRVFAPAAARDAENNPTLRAAWARTVGARRAAHLRAVAARLLEPGPDCEPMRCDVVLMPVFVGTGIVPVELPPQWHGLRMARPFEPPPDSTLTRLRNHATRRWVRRGDEVFVWSCSRPPGGDEYQTLRAWACAGTGLSFLLRPRSAAALIDYAAQIERFHGIADQPPLWLRAPHGRLAELGRALGRAGAAMHRAGRWPPEASAGASIDLLRPRSDPALQPLLRLLARTEGGGFALTQVLCRQDRPGDRLHVTLEIRKPTYARVVGWLDGGEWMPLAAWPGIDALIRGPVVVRPPAD